MPDVRVHRIRTGRWGWSSGPGAPTQLDLDPDAGIGISRAGQRVELRPFMGIRL
jgi:hypothetical protein